MNRTEIIQRLADKVNAKKYLEIGIGNGKNFNDINCEYKVSVEPFPVVSVTHTKTSDDFFAQNNEMFDIVFIDGLHWSEQVYLDINNSLFVLNDGGYIVCHDMSPNNEFIQLYPNQDINSEWTGDCWKAWVKLRRERDDLLMFVVDTDYGCGVITRGTQEKLVDNDELTWKNLEMNREKWLKLVSVAEFNILYDGSRY